MFVCKRCKVRTRNCATSSWPAQPLECGSDDWRHAAESSRTRGVAQALIARVKAADPSIKRVDELLLCAAVACRADKLDGVPRPFALGRWARTYRGRSSPGDRLWVARLEKLEQTLAAESGSSLLVLPQLGSRRMCWPDFCAISSLVRKPPACLCQVHR